MANPEQEKEWDKNKSFEDLTYGVGQMADGTFNIFPASELAARVAKQDKEDAESVDELLARINKERDDDVAKADADAAEAAGKAAEYAPFLDILDESDPDADEEDYDERLDEPDAS